MGKLDTRETILEAARSEFIRNGYAASRMRSIAEKAEINKGLLHYYFKSKDSLFAEVFQQTFKELFEQLDEMLVADQPFRDKLSKAVEVYIDYMLRQPELPLFIVNEVSRDAQGHKRRMRAAKFKPPFKELVTAIQKAKKNGEVRDDLDIRHFMISMISLILFPIISKSMVKMINNLNEEEYRNMIEQRKEHIIELLETISAPTAQSS